MKARGGRNLGGYAIGILVLDTVIPRIPGDIGHAGTFDFPVLYRKVPGAFPDRVVRKADPTLLQPFIEGAKELEGAGVGAITTSCGFLAMFQRELSATIQTPVFASSLLMVPLLAQMQPAGKRVGILTVDAASLTARHLEAVGVTPDVPHVVRGVEPGGEFAGVMLDNLAEMDVEKARGELVGAARAMCTDQPDVGAIVLECTNMPPHARAIQEATGRPVYDIVTLVRWVHSGLVQRAYLGAALRAATA